MKGKGYKRTSSCCNSSKGKLPKATKPSPRVGSKPKRG